MCEYIIFIIIIIFILAEVGDSYWRVTEVEVERVTREKDKIFYKKKKKRQNARQRGLDFAL